MTLHALHRESATFSLGVVPAGPEACRASLSGEIDLAAAQQLRHRLAEAARHHRSVVLDLSGVTFMDAAGLSLLVTTRRVGRAHSTRFEVVGAGPRVREVLRLTGLDEVLGVAPHHPALTA